MDYNGKKKYIEAADWMNNQVEAYASAFTTCTYRVSAP